MFKKEKGENQNPPPIIDLFRSGPESDEDRKIVRSDYEEDNFYSFLGDDHYGLVEDIKKWESNRYTI